MTGDKIHKLLERPDIDTWPESAASGTERGMSLGQAHLWQVHPRREKIERRYEFPPGHNKAFFGRLSTAPQLQAGYPTRQYELRSKRPAVQHQLPGVRSFLNGEGDWAPRLASGALRTARETIGSLIFKINGPKSRLSPQGACPSQAFLPH